jgi:DNA-binding transcriptional regulator LsrR (DeoR family)
MAQQSKIKSTKDKEMEQSKEDTKLKNNKKQIEWRRNKVRQLLLRGNTQSEISRTLDISQPTISRDIAFIQSRYITNSKNTYTRLSEEYINISLGIDEMIKNSWKIVDDNRTNVKTRLKAMSGIKECYKYKMEMLGTERTLNQMNTLYKQMLVKEKELTRRENALKAFLEGRKLTEDEIFRETNPNRVF